jgi:excinuclease UvrABC helicase subunit UvrB
MKLPRYLDGRLAGTEPLSFDYFQSYLMVVDESHVTLEDTCYVQW